MSRKFHIGHWAVIAAASSVTMASSSLLAQIVAGPGGGVSSNVSVTESPLGQFNLGPLTVSYGSGSGAIGKTLYDLEDRNGDGFINGTDFNLLVSSGFELNETIVVGPGSPFTDWHEVVTTPGMAWGSVTATLAGNEPIPGLVTSVTSTNVDLTFDPLPPGTTLDIDKQLNIASAAAIPYLLPDFNQEVPNGTEDYGSLVVQEYPTSVPEPASLGIIALGGTCLIHRPRAARAKR